MFLTLTGRSHGLRKIRVPKAGEDSFDSTKFSNGIDSAFVERCDQGLLLRLRVRGVSWSHRVEIWG